MYKLSSTKIPEYLSQTVNTRSSKMEMHRMTSKWTWTPNSLKYSIYTKYLPLGANFGPFRSTISHFRYTTCTKSSKISNAPNDPNWTSIEHLTVKGTLYTIDTYPWSPNFGPLRSTTSRFRDTTCTRGRRKSEMHRMTPNWIWTLNSQKFSICTKWLPLRSKFLSVSL